MRVASALLSFFASMAEQVKLYIECFVSLLTIVDSAIRLSIFFLLLCPLHLVICWQYCLADPGRLVL